MEKYSFSSKNGFCPSCKAHGRTWYIQDRYISGNIYNYCLMSASNEAPEILRFKNKKEIAVWYNKGDDDVTFRWHIPKRDECSNAALIVKDGVRYRYDKSSCTLTVIQESKQETGWFDSYRECLRAAKEILNYIAAGMAGN